MIIPKRLDGGVAPFDFRYVTFFAGLEANVVSPSNLPACDDLHARERVRESRLKRERDGESANAEPGDQRCDRDAQTLKNEQCAEDEMTRRIRLVINVAPAVEARPWLE